MRPHLVSGWWKDTGKIEDILEANRLILESFQGKISGQVDKASKIEGEVVIEEKVTVQNSTIHGPAIIGAGTEIINSHIGPFTSIQEKCKIVEAEIEHSIILDGSEIQNVGDRIKNSLIGRDVKIYKCPPKPSAYRFMLGDKSEVGLK